MEVRLAEETSSRQDIHSPPSLHKMLVGAYSTVIAAAPLAHASIPVPPLSLIKKVEVCTVCDHQNHTKLTANIATYAIMCQRRVNIMLLDQPLVIVGLRTIGVVQM